MSIPYMDPASYIRARAEQLAMQADLVKFQDLYVARGLAFRSINSQVTTATFDEFVEPFRQIAAQELKTAVLAAQHAYQVELERRLAAPAFTGEHDALDGLTDAEVAEILAVEKELGI